MYNLVMTIYIETFLIQNIIINFCLLKLVQVTTKNKTSIFRLVLSSIIGAGLSVVSAVLISNNIAINVLKFICSFIMLLTAFKQSKKQFMLSFLLFFIYTYALGGAIISLSGTTYATNFGVVTSSKFNLSLVCLIIIAITYLFEFALKHIKSRIKLNSLVYEITIFKDNNSLKLNAFLDTGNQLNFNGQPVLVLDFKTYLKLTKQNIISYITNPAMQTTISTVAGKQNVNLYLIDKLQIKVNNKTKELINQLVAINFSSTFKNTNYQALLSPMFL